MKKIDEFKGKDFDEIINKIYKSDYFFTASLKQLCQYFISSFTEKLVFQLTYVELRNETLNLVANPKDVPEGESEFYSYICSKYLHLDSLPANVMLRYYQTATKDLKILQERIKLYKQQLEDLYRKSPETEDLKYQKKIISYYKKLNEEAHQEIIDFLFYKIKDFTTFQCTNHPLMTTIIYGGVPYSFKILSEFLKWESFSDLHNKFENLDVNERLKMERLYKEDKPAFYNETRKYIESNDIVNGLKRLISRNHTLAGREKILNEALDAFTNGNKYLFLAVITLQIEGLFGDYCLELGAAEKAVRSGSLTTKVELAASKNSQYRHLVYYAYRYPIIRNQVAHGHLVNDFENQADYLLLDLYDVCKALTSVSLPKIKTMTLVKIWAKDKKDIRYQVKYSLYHKYKVPEFYNLTKEEAEIRKSLNSETFWNYLKYLISENDAMINKGVYKIAHVLRKEKLEPKRCNEIMMLLGDVSEEGFDEQQFFDELNEKAYNLELPF